MIVESGISRKRKTKPDEWVKNKKKVARNSKESKKRPYIACQHNKASNCEAKQLSQDDIKGNS